jgi:hypothetical protein
MSDRYKAGDTVIYSRLVNRKLTDLEAVFVRYILVGTDMRRMCVIHVRGTLSPRVVATTSITDK